MAVQELARLAGVLTVSVESSDVTGRVLALLGSNSSGTAGRAQLLAPSGTYTLDATPGSSEWRCPLALLTAMPLADELLLTCTWPA